MASPTPPTGTPSPLAIGLQFIRSYYNTLSTNPESILKFYKQDSFISHGDGSQPSLPNTLEDSRLSEDLLFSIKNFRVDLEQGAIDAQMSVNGAVLVMVTGHILFGDKKRRAFCHTVLLNNAAPPDAPRKQYYVLNDVMRFLAETEHTEGATQVKDVPEAETETETNGEPMMEPEEVEPPAEEARPVEETVVEEASSPEVEERRPEEEEPPMYEPALEPEPAVEETKEEIPPLTAAAQSKRKSRKGGRKQSRSPSNEKKPPAGSWASLVANNTGSATPAAAPASPAPGGKRVESTKQDTKQQSKQQPQATDDPQQQGKQQQKRRDPECTLVIKNIPQETKEVDVRKMFEPFAVQTSRKIVGLNVSAAKGLAFVDFDSPAPVLLALKQQHKFQLHGRPVEVEQKSVDARKRGSSGSSNSGQPTRGGGSDQQSGNGYRRLGSQRRGNINTSGGGRSERGGGSSGRGGRGGR